MPKKIIDLSTSEKMRRDFKRRLNMYRNDWKDDLETVVNGQYVREVSDRLKKLLDISENIFSRIIRDICTVYKEPSTRILKIGEKEIVSNRWAEITKELFYDVMMAEAHRRARACAASFFHVRTTDGGNLIVNVYTPDIIHVEVDANDAKTPESISYMFTHEKNNFWVFYDNKRRLFLNDSGELLDKDPRTDEYYDQENQYGIIPVVPFHAVFPVCDFWNKDYNKDAYEANIIIGVQSTNQAHLIKCNCHKQIVLSGEVNDRLKNAILDPAYPFILGDGGTATTLDLTSSAIKDIDEHIQKKIIAIAGNYGISASNFTITGNVQSGFALKIKNSVLEEIRKSDILLCDWTEKRLFNVIRTVNNIDFPDSLIPEDAELKFNPGEVVFPETWEEESGRWTFEFQIGASNVIDYMIAKDPQLTRKEAEKKLMQIKEENGRISPKKSMASELMERIGQRKEQQPQSQQRPESSQGGEV